MGLKMYTKRKQNFPLRTLLVLTGIGLLVWSIGSSPERSQLMASLSMLTLLSFLLLIGQYFSSRTGNINADALTMCRLPKFHNNIGYASIMILLFHPLYLVIPKFFEKGVAPGEAFFTILTTFSSRGVVLGVISWELMLILLVTALFRKRIPVKYTTWRTAHSILAMLFIVTASCHVIDMGRHINYVMETFIIILAGSCLLFQLKRLIFSIFKKTRVRH